MEQQDKQNEPTLETPDVLTNKRRNRIILIFIAFVVLAMIIGASATVYSLIKATSHSRDTNQTTDTSGRKVENQLIGTVQAEKNWQFTQELRTKKLEDGQDKILKLLGELNTSQKVQQQPQGQPVRPMPQQPVYQSQQPTPPPPPIASPKKESRTDNQDAAPQARHESTVLKTFKEFTPEKSDLNTSGAGEIGGKSSRKKIQIPSSVFSGITLTGMAAPSMEYGKDNPMPILIAITSKGIVANDKSIDLRGCLVMGSGYGDVSQEKVLVNLAKISCVDKSGQMLESRISGWVVDKADGQVGIGGHVVSKQGSVLAKSWMAGTLEGVSGILKQMGTTTSISPLGTTQSMDSADVAKIAAASGFQTASSSLAQFYMKMANKMYQVVELSPGRRVSIYLEDRENKPNILEQKDIYFNPNPLQ